MTTTDRDTDATEGRYGPTELMLIAFPDNRFRSEIVTELQRLVSDRTIRIIDLVLVTKGGDGAVTALEIGDLADEDAAAFADVVSGDLELIAAEDVELLAAELTPDASMGVMVFEHSWAVRLAHAVRRANGRVIDAVRVPAVAIEELTAHLTEANR